MRVVLFGAGASYGCGGVTPRNPPLGNDLFTDLQKLYANWRSIPSEAVERFKIDFEEGMENVIEHYGFAVGPLMQEMARFFSIFQVSNSHPNLYLELLRRSESEDEILWSTLNYDCIVESAISILGKRVAYFADPKAGIDDISVWKLHGSCNFKVKGIEATRGIVYSGQGITFGGEIEPIDPGEVSGVYGGNTALYPAMALYARGKSISMSPDPILQGQRQWAVNVGACDRVLIIGVNPNINDDHIWMPLSNTSAEIGYVGSAKSFNDWVGRYHKAQSSNLLGTNWKDCEKDVETFLFD